MAASAKAAVVKVVARVVARAVAAEDVVRKATVADKAQVLQVHLRPQDARRSVIAHARFELKG